MRKGLLTIALCIFCVSLSLQIQQPPLATTNSSEKSPFYRFILSSLNHIGSIKDEGYQGFKLFSNNYTVNLTIKIKSQFLDINEDIQKIPIEFQLESQPHNSSYTDLMETLNSQKYKISRSQSHILTLQLQEMSLKIDFGLEVYLTSLMVLAMIRTFQGDFAQQLRKYFSIETKFYCKGWSYFSHAIEEISVYQVLYTWGIVVSRFKILSNFNSSWGLFFFSLLVLVYSIQVVVVSLRFKPSSRIIFYHYLFYCTLMALNLVKTDYALYVIILLQVYELLNVYFGKVIRQTVFRLLDVSKIFMFHVYLLILCRISQRYWLFASFGLSLILIFASIDRVHVYTFILRRIRMIPYLFRLTAALPYRRVLKIEPPFNQ